MIHSLCDPSTSSFHCYNKRVLSSQMRNSDYGTTALPDRWSSGLYMSTATIIATSLCSSLQMSPENTSNHLSQITSYLSIHTHINISLLYILFSSYKLVNKHWLLMFPLKLALHYSHSNLIPVSLHA